MNDEKENEFITNCEHCKGLGCSLCEDPTLNPDDDITLPYHNKEAMEAVLDFINEGKK